MKLNNTNQHTQLNPCFSDINAKEEDGILYFTVDLGGSDIQLWKTDGTPTGTVLIEQVELYE